MKKLLLAVIFVAVLVWALSPLPTKLRQERQIAKLKKELKQEQVKNKALQQEISRLKNDKSYIEQVARKSLGLVKPDEEAYLVVEKVKIKKIKEKAVPKNWWQRFWQQIKEWLY